jgi:hypothetical protein
MARTRSLFPIALSVERSEVAENPDAPCARRGAQWSVASVRSIERRSYSDFGARHRAVGPYLAPRNDQETECFTW